MGMLLFLVGLLAALSGGVKLRKRIRASVGVSTLASLEESRVALWSARAIYSFFDVGPFEDVRLEGAVNLEQFEPVDTGRCAEPYAIWLICLKSTGLWAHGTTGAGIAGEVRPPLKGLTKEQRREVEVVIRTLKTAIAQIQSSDGKEEQDNVVALNA